MKCTGFFIAILLCILGNNCAYYNTFYNAKTAYNKAMESKKNSPNQQASPELLNKVIEKCGKVIKYYPRSGWTDDAVILMGKAFLEKGEYDKAQRKFEEIVIYYSESPFVAEALYLMGVSYLRREDYNLAVGSFNQVLRLEEGKFKDAASFGIMEAYFEKREFDNLLEVGSDFVRTHQKSSFLPRALLLVGNAYMEREDLDGAVESFRKARGKARRREDKNDIDEKYAVALIKKGNIDEGLSILKTLSEKSTNEERTAALTFEIVDAYLQDNSEEKALEELDNFTTLYSSGPYAAESYYRQGLIYEQRMADIESAINAYNNASKLYPEKDILALSIKRSTILKEIMELKEELANPDSSTELSKTHLLLAEVYFFEKENVDTALAEYRLVLDSFPDSPNAPKAAMAIAWIYEREKQDSTKALSTYELIVEMFPETEYASSAVSAIERLRGMQTNEEIQDPDGEPSTMESSGNQMGMPGRPD